MAPPPGKEGKRIVIEVLCNCITCCSLPPFCFGICPLQLVVVCHIIPYCENLCGLLIKSCLTSLTLSQRWPRWVGETSCQRWGHGGGSWQGMVRACEEIGAGVADEGVD